MKTSQKIGLVSLAAATVALVIAVSKEPKVQSAFTDAQVNFGKWYKTNITPLVRQLKQQKIGLTL
jgi:hypothetical protein